MPYLHVPTHLQTWDDASIADFQAKLWFGDATLGWSGDPQLQLARTEAGAWEIWRHEENGTWNRAMQSPEGAVLTPEAITKCIRRLVDTDMQRSVDPHLAVSVIDDTEKRIADQESLATERFNEAANAVYKGLRKDLG